MWKDAGTDTPNTRSKHTNLGRVQTWVSNEFSLKVFLEKLNSDRDFLQQSGIFSRFASETILLEWLLYLLFLNIYVLSYLVALGLSCSTQDLSSLTRTGTWPLALETPSPSQWTTREVPLLSLRVELNKQCNHWNSTRWIDSLGRTRGDGSERWGQGLWGSLGDVALPQRRKLPVFPSGWAKQSFLARTHLPFTANLSLSFLFF